MIRLTLTQILVAIFLVTSIDCWPASTLAAQFVYVSLDGENRIVSYAINSTTGELTKSKDTVLPSPAGALTVSPDRRFLFASLRAAGRLASFRLDSGTGQLVPLGTVAAGADPAFVATDRTGRFLLTAYYVAGQVTVHAIGADGVLGDQPIQTVPTNDKAHAVLTDPSNRFAFVPHTAPNEIHCFRFQEQTGRLSPNVASRVGTGNNTGPRQFVFHPRHDLVFFDYEQGSAIAAYDFNRETGQLTFRELHSTLPPEYRQSNSNARIDLTPNGRFIYVANRGHDSLAVFEVSEPTGNLIPRGQTKTEATPRGFAIDPTGRHLYAAGQATGKLAAFHINPQSGELTRFTTYPVGERPWWVLTVETDSLDP